MPDSGTLTIQTEPFEGSIIQYTALAAAVESDEGNQIAGIVTRHQYTIVCGALTGGSIGLASGTVSAVPL
jgi:hypothetical protein